MSTLKTLAKPLLLLAWICLLGFFFANVEIQIEGDAGWAADLPTWRIESGWALDLFWGGRPLTGYHAWVFSFMFLIFHVPVFVFSKWNWRIEARLLGCIQLFWIVEDFLWFVLNPAFGFSKFHQDLIPWHKQWFWFMPVDYWTFTVLGCALLWISYFGLPWKRTGGRSTDSEPVHSPRK